MAVYRVGDIVNFPLNLKVHRIFGYRDNIYYVVEIIQDNVPWKKAKKMFGTLDYNGRPNVPDVVLCKADTIIRDLQNLNPE